MKISGVIDPDFKFSTLWKSPLIESIPEFFFKVITPAGIEEKQQVLNGDDSSPSKKEIAYHIGVVSCFTLFPLLTLPLHDLLQDVPAQEPGAAEAMFLVITFFVFALVSALTALAAAVLTLPAIVPIAMARGGYEFFKTGGVLDYCKISIAETFKSKGT